MKMKSVTISLIRLPMKQPFSVAYDTYFDMPSIIVKIETDQGIAGFGEAVPDQHVTGETAESTFAILAHYLAPLLIGEHPFSIEKIHDLMDQTVYGNPSAKAAIDIACYDLMGKAFEQPLYNLLGGKYYPVLDVPHVVGIQEPEKMAQEASEAIKQGYSSLKIKVGTSNSKDDVERIRAVRRAVGESVQLRVDANQGWKNKAFALSVLKQVEDCQIDWIEQPVLADDIAALAEIRNQTSIPVMADEGLQGNKEMREIVAMQAADLINIKLMKCGGIYPALKLVSQAEMAGMGCIIGSMIESSVATAAGAHLATAKKQIIANEMAGPLIFSSDLSPLDYRGSKLYLSDRPGLGIDIDESVLKEILVRQETILK
ncbi:mandelate racemase/muconate lactonizing enzyme family protein [uncultured Brevibacillus sp.]|uniref:mandelate racemase/muconate lactonizing enzyme family protein n=1 Tax=uncultured Brevibacillus sp. TaxID=169970 RepID=UPI0025924580|nr:dipeptide epimerase [uncultured Brevibacillus sp.]